MLDEKKNEYVNNLEKMLEEKYPKVYRKEGILLVLENFIHFFSYDKDECIKKMQKYAKGFEEHGEYFGMFFPTYEEWGGY